MSYVPKTSTKRNAGLNISYAVYVPAKNTQKSSGDQGEYHPRKARGLKELNECKGTCTKYHFQKPIRGMVYQEGVKRCSRCERFVKWEGRYCPCCRHQLRTGPKTKKYRDKREKARI